MELKINTLLRNGTYRILKKLGQGSFGITYLAEHTAQGKKVAIKEFFMKGINSRSDDGSITGMTNGSFSYNYGQKFKREVRNLAKLEHPNIVRVTDYFEENNTYYYVMDFIEGDNLNDYLNSHTVSENEAIAIIKDVASALTYMHDQHHMLHLDLKPGNVMRRASDGHIFLIDFGLSKHYSNDGQPETSTTIGLGTLGYAPIEQGNQARGGEFRPTIDVYALGATLYKLLTGETPPAASDVLADKELLSNKLKQKGISQSVTNLVMEAMEPVVKNRIPTVNEFSRRLTESNSIPPTPKSLTIPPLPKEPSDFSHNNENTRFANPYTEETKVHSQTNEKKDTWENTRTDWSYTYPNQVKQQQVTFSNQPQTKKKKYGWLGTVIFLVICFVIGAVISEVFMKDKDIMQTQEFNNYIEIYNISHQANGIQLDFTGNNNPLVIHFNMPYAQYQRLPSFNQWNNYYFKLDNRFLSTLRNSGCTIYIYFYDPYTTQLYDTMTITSSSY